MARTRTHAAEARDSLTPTARRGANGPRSRAGCAVWSNDGLFAASRAGRLRYELADEVNQAPVGDWVAINQQGGTTTMQEVLPHTSTCVRKSAGRAGCIGRCLSG